MIQSDSSPESHHTESYYAATTIGLRSYPKIKESERCDVCVIGGGFTGLSTALNLAELGYDTVLLEAQQIGWGASGRNGGQVGTGMHWSQQELENEFGAEQAAKLWDITELAKREVAKRISHHQIACDYKPGVLATAVTRKAATALEKNAVYLQEHYNYTAIRYVSSDEVSEMLGTSRYFGGSLDTSAGHFHPLNFAIGLARAATDVGVRIYETSPVHAYHKKLDGYFVETNLGTEVHARYVVFACNAYIDRLRIKFSRYIIPIESLIVATEPLSTEQASELIRDDVAVYDSKFCLDYYRLSADKRLLFGGGEAYIPNLNIDVARTMKRRIIAVYPQLTNIRIDYAWRGKIAITTSRLPSIGRLYPDVYYAQGFSGHGVALTNMVGKILADTIAGTAEQFDVLASIPHRPIPGGRVMRWPIHVIGMYYYALADRLMTRSFG